MFTSDSQGAGAGALKKTTAELTREKIADVAALATEADKASVAEILATASTGRRGTAVYKITAPMAAMIFLDHNAHNRDWRAEGVKSCLEYARRMNTGQWQWNNATIGFYTDAQLEDGQHRLSAAAIAGYTLEIVIVFGVDRDAKATVDDGAARHASDAVKIDGVASGKSKQVLVKFAAGYNAKAGDPGAALHSEVDIARVIKANSLTLDEALDIGEKSTKNITQPVLKSTQAAQIAYLFLTASPPWSSTRVRESLALFQTGTSLEGEKTPSFVAGEVIVAARKKREQRERLSPMKEIGVAICALVEAERGVKAVSASALKAAVKGSNLPSPGYPDTGTHPAE